MKKIIVLVFCMALAAIGYCQQTSVKITFVNDYTDVFHLSLIIYTPDGKSQTRVSDVAPGKKKVYEYAVGAAIYIADWKQETYAMKGNDIKASGAKPYIILAQTDNNRSIKLSTVSVQRPLDKQDGQCP
jgi:hypothetical protein